MDSFSLPGNEAATGKNEENTHPLLPDHRFLEEDNGHEHTQEIAHGRERIQEIGYTNEAIARKIVMIYREILNV